VGGEKGKMKVRLGTHITVSFLVGTRKSKSDLNVTARETKLVPTLKHARAIRHPIRRNVFDSDVKGTIEGIDLTWIVPLLIASLQVPEVDRFPIGIITGIECSVIEIELIRENKVIGLTIETNASLG
jgi:hypothetical protein